MDCCWQVADERAQAADEFLGTVFVLLGQISHLLSKFKFMATRCHPRALERVAAATFESTQSQLKEDMAAIELFLEGVDEWANRQAALDH